jgi:hypothetical protein
MPVEYRDLFKFNKELLDDDYNPGQALVNKTKHNSSQGPKVVRFLYLFTF